MKIYNSIQRDKTEYLIELLDEVVYHTYHIKKLNVIDDYRGELYETLCEYDMRMFKKLKRKKK